jgi:hypothetical protein
MHLEDTPQLQVLELRSTRVSAARKAEFRRRFPKLLILDDGAVLRMIDPNASRDKRFELYLGRNKLVPLRGSVNRNWPGQAGAGP